jgi:2'-5' RNA ligase
MYSIWLMPSDKELMRYQDIIDEFSLQFDTAGFEPHITLFTGIETLTDDLIYQVSVLAALTDTFELVFNELALKNNYFKAIYLKPDLDDSLIKMNEELMALFPSVHYTFKPHLALLYGNVSKENKEDFLQQVDNPILGNFHATTLRIMKTVGEVEMWQTIEDFPLHHKNQAYLDLISDMVQKTRVYRDV